MRLTKMQRELFGDMKMPKRKRKISSKTRDQLGRFKPKVERKVRLASRVPLTISPKLRGYQSIHPNNPIFAGLNELSNDGKLLGMDPDERAYLADLLADLLAQQAEMTGMGNAITLRIRNFILGRNRADVIG